MSDRGDRILVVEDDPFFRAVLARQLAEDGYTNVATVEDGEQALQRLRPADIDLVLLDIEIPEPNGIEVLRRIQGNREREAIPVLVISGVDDIARIVQCIELGADDYLTKPFNPVILRARIGACLEKRRLRKLQELHLAQIRAEQRKSDELLNVILPAPASQELRMRGAVAPRRHQPVAVMFCDIVGFTTYCDKHDAEEVVANLQALVECFEEITGQHEMEKIKTIGDSFMATAGVLRPNAQPAASAVRCGLAMICATPAIVPDWRVRVGVDCGSIVSGVLGRQKYQFDVWGRTVNVAARMTELASPGTVAVTQATWSQLDGAFLARPLGRQEIKGLGMLEALECYGFSGEHGQRSM